MFAARDASSSGGLRAVVGRFLHGLLQYRLFQLVGAAWSYLMGPWGTSILSFLIPGWIVHRQVTATEFPDMFKGLGPGPWEELEECLEDLGPWKELVVPALAQSSWEEELLSSLGFVSQSKGHSAWKTCYQDDLRPKVPVQEIWEPGVGSYEDFAGPPIEESECHLKASLSAFNLAAQLHDSNICKMPNEMNSSHLSNVGIVSCILSPGSPGLLTLVSAENEEMLPVKDAFCEISSGNESMVEVQHIRNKRLWFLQQNQASDGVKPVVDQHQQLTEHCKSQNMAQKQYDCNQDLMCNWDQYSEPLASDQSVETSVPYLQEETLNISDGELQTHKVLKVAPSCLLHNQDIVGGVLIKDQPSPDQDQGYFSLEDCSNINLEKTQIHQLCTTVVGAEHQNPCPSISEPTQLNYSNGDSDLEELSVFTRPLCANKHIRYILGTTSSDEEEDDDDESSCADSQDSVGAEEDDDGFDSEGSVSETDSETQDAEGVELWNSFYTPDPYNPQNFTAIQHTGSTAEETSQLVVENEDIPSDQESWCDSDALSAINSEDEYSADEEENLKLWNSFNNFDDPYNPLCFKAPVQSSERKNLNADAISKYTETVSANSSSSKLSSFCPTAQTNNKHILQVDTNCANPPKKKVTFLDEVTVYNVCSKEDRKGPWEEFARDRCRFQRRIQETEAIIRHCLTSDHRQKIWDTIRKSWVS